MNTLKIPFHRANIGEEEIEEVVKTLRSGWLTTGPKTKQFESEFAVYMGTKHAVALNSATAALHLALEATGLKRGQAVLVPTMTFAATAEVVRYFDAKPILVDCRPDDFNLDVADARRKAEAAVARGESLHAIIPVHYGGLAADMAGVLRLARDFKLRVIEDAAHCCPAQYRDGPGAPWKLVGSESDVCCYSFYANKCITTGEGGMACTNDDSLAERMRIMGLHGISKDAWKRFSSEGSWYYEIIAPGFKYNLTDIASSIGLWQLRRSSEFRCARERVALAYRERLLAVPEVIVPPAPVDRVHSWHLFAIRLRLEHLSIDRAAVIAELKQAGIGASVHWMPLHMHPYYRQLTPIGPAEFPVSTAVYPQLISLPIFPAMTDADVEYVVESLARIVRAHLRR